MIMESIKYKELYQNPDCKHVRPLPEAQRRWLREKAGEWKVSTRSPMRLAVAFLQAAGVGVMKIEKYGLPCDGGWPHPSFAFKRDDIFDHCKVVRNKLDGALWILTEPYTTVDQAEWSPILQAWRSLGCEVRIESYGGWHERTIAIWIGPPKGAGK
jgi:hypothetical protein